ncbi:SUKH-3 domain-containing protein [Streptomyces sp. NPDC004100]
MTGVSRPGATGVFVDIGLPVGGFVDVLLLPTASERWPEEGTVAEFELWWVDERPQVRLKPMDRQFLREDFDEWLSKWRPGWAAERGQVVLEDTALAQAWVDAMATPLRGVGAVTGFTAETEETLRTAGWFPGRCVSVELWRERLEESGEVRMHEAARSFLAEFGGLSVRFGGPGVTCARSSFDFDAGLVVGEEGRFAEWSRTIGRALFPIGELDEGRFFLGIDQHGEIYLVETWVAAFGPAQEALEKLVLGIGPEAIA